MTKSDSIYLRDVSLLGCIICRNLGWGPSLAEIHHVRSGVGMAQRAAHTRVLPLCPRHHRACYPTGFHAAPKSWQAEHGSEETLLAQVATEVAELRKNTIGRAA
ncbi:Ref family recombination enhancement nuclease [Aeromonas bestiarum]|uniref:Ref family recombination enhancement nuclease n=1 Tax=Aeromonas bestiarum TaxID=105751 RepID=UPI000504B755|nr:Ref family recombination enhancement nuclease [Aeromonas bestiarum]KFN19255.1 hypothetical protein JM66_10920 [Aeromonas bestiarum]